MSGDDLRLLRFVDVLQVRYLVNAGIEQLFETCGQ